MAYGFAPAWRGALHVLTVIPALALCLAGPLAASPDNRLAPLAGAMPPSITLDRLGGGRSSAGSPGRIVLVHFFATWCEPCRPELASLDRLRRESGKRGLDIVAISVAEVEARLDRFFAENPVGFPILLDRDRAASRAWAIDALPSTIVLDRAGEPRLAVRGDLDWQRDDVRAVLDTLLAESGRETTKPSP